MTIGKLAVNTFLFFDHNWARKVDISKLQERKETEHVERHAGFFILVENLRKKYKKIKVSVGMYHVMCLYSIP